VAPPGFGIRGDIILSDCGDQQIIGNLICLLFVSRFSNTCCLAYIVVHEIFYINSIQFKEFISTEENEEKL